MSLRGLKGLEYFDNTDSVEGKVESEEEVRIRGETDRVYKAAPDVITVRFQHGEPKGGTLWAAHTDGLPQSS